MAPDPKAQQTMQAAGLTRYYLIYVPQNYDPMKPLPLIFGIHGLDMNNVWAAHADSGLKLIEETKDQALLIYPQGQGEHPGNEPKWGGISSNWGGPPGATNAQRLQQDLAFFDALIEHATQNYCIDLDRIFAMGFSQGGFMTNTLACERPSVIRAIAPVAGWGPHGFQPSCSKQEAAPAVLSTQGDKDGTVTPMLGQQTRDFWRQRAGCQAATMPSATYGNGCVEFQGCDPGKPVVYCTHPGEHWVPGESGGRAWKFFQQF